MNSTDSTIGTPCVLASAALDPNHQAVQKADRRTARSALPLATITGLVATSELQVARIAAAVLATSVLPGEVASLQEITALIQAKLAALDADERHCLQVLRAIAQRDFGSIPELALLDEGECAERAPPLTARLQAHLAQARALRGTLERGLESGRAGMLRRFAIFAVAGLSADVGRADGIDGIDGIDNDDSNHNGDRNGDCNQANTNDLADTSGLDSGSAFLIAFLVAVRLKDRLQSAGFRWAGEKTLISIYLNAVGCERRRSKARQVADPAASAIATALGFISALQLHQALAGLHAFSTGQCDRHELEVMRFDRAPCEAFDHAYLAHLTPQQEMRRIVARASRSARPDHAPRLQRPDSTG